MKLVVLCIVAASLFMGGAAINKQYFGCDARFPCISITMADAKPG